MNIQKVTLTALISLSPLILSSGKPNRHPDANTVFRQVAEKLASLNVIKYRYTRTFNYPSEGYVSKTTGEMYIDFDKRNDLVGFRYQYTDTNVFSIFNNSEIFDGSLKDKTIAVAKQLAPKSFEGRSALFNSVITLRNALPGIINDPGIPKNLTDTVISNKSFYLLQFVLQNKTLNYLGTGFSPTTVKLTFNYQLIVDKETWLPLTLSQTTVSSRDLSRVDFSGIDLHPAPVDEKSWYYSSYLDRYTLQSPAKMPVPIKTGETAPDWLLSNYTTGTEERLSKYKGKVVLMEFWIKNCSYCIEAVSKLNELNEVYNQRNFKLLAINTEDSRKSITVFTANHKINYTVVYGDDNTVNKNYGIAYFPQAVLVNKAGKVIYSGSVDVQLLKQIIEKNL